MWGKLKIYDYIYANDIDKIKILIENNESMIDYNLEYGIDNEKYR